MAVKYACRRNPAFRRSASPDRLGEIGEEIVGDFFRRAIDQPLAELRQLAADLRFDVVAQQRAAILVGQRDRRAAFGKAGDAAVALPGNLIAIGWIEVGEIDDALEARL